MSEVAFCKSFLAALDARPIKLSSDHIADARQYPSQSVYALPRLPHPPHPARPNPSPSGHDSSSSASVLSISLKPMKSTFPTLSLDNVHANTTSVYDLKQKYSASATIDASKIKLLYKKKPVADLKTVTEVVGDNAAGEIEFVVMIMGAMSGPTLAQNTPTIAPTELKKGLDDDVSGPANDSSTSPVVAASPSGKEVVDTDEFWSDLNSFVVQRIKDKSEGEKLTKIFKTAWETHR